MKRTAAFVTLLALSQMTVACSGERAFQQFQMCLGGRQGFEQLKTELKAIALDRGMKFIDQSDSTFEDLKVINSDLAKRPIIQLYLEGRDYGLTVSNVGLGGYQVAVGFGPESPKAHSFADQVTQRLQKFWTLYDVPLDEGIFPLSECAE